MHPCYFEVFRRYLARICLVTCALCRVKHKATPRCNPSAAAAFLSSLPPNITRLQDHAVVADIMAMDPAFAHALQASCELYTACVCVLIHVCYTAFEYAYLCIQYVDTCTCIRKRTFTLHVFTCLYACVCARVCAHKSIYECIHTWIQASEDFYTYDERKHERDGQTDSRLDKVCMLRAMNTVNATNTHTQTAYGYMYMYMFMYRYIQ
jgi:hypothetical protein